MVNILRIPYSSVTQVPVPLHGKSIHAVGGIYKSYRITQTNSRFAETEISFRLRVNGIEQNSCVLNAAAITGYPQVDKVRANSPVPVCW
jgi:hypothetical protein